MPVSFKPTQIFTRWLGRLSVGRKLTLIYLLDLTAVIYVSSILIHEKFQSIDFTRKEIVGTAYSVAVRDVLMQPFLPPQAGALPPSVALLRLDVLRVSHDEALKTAQASKAFVDSWQKLIAETRPVEHQTALRPMLRQARELLTTVGNQSNLILDPDLDSYYAMSLVVLRFPELLEVLNDTIRILPKAPSAVAIPSGVQDRRTELLILAGRLDAVALGIRSDYNQAFAAGTPAQRTALQASRKVLEARLGEFLAAVQLLADGDANPHNLELLQQHYGDSLMALTDAWARTATDLDRLLHERVDALFNRMWLHLGTAFLLLSCILSLVYAVARQIARPLKNLASVADAVRQTGDHSRRAVWHSRDEIGQLVAAFNGMLAQLDQQRLAEQEVAARNRAAQAQQALVEAIPIALLVTSVPDHEVLHANAPALPWLAGQTRDPWRAGLEPGVRARFFQQLSDQGKVDEFEVRWLGGAEPSWAVLSARRLQFQGRDAVLTAFTPINVLKVMERRLELWAKVFEASSESIIIMDGQQKILSVNRAFCRSTSYDFYEVIGEPLSVLLEEAATVEQSLNGLSQDRDAWQGEVHFRKRSGETYPAWLMISAVRDGSRFGAVSQYIGISVDITDRKRTEARVQFLAQHDVLTELPNRALCVIRLEAAIEAAQRSGERVAVLFIDLDRFKNINDTLGHHIGDGVLRSVASRLSQAVRGDDTVSRLGGDEYVVILRGVAGPEEVQQTVEHRLIPLIRQTHHVDGHDLQVSCSVGIALYPDDGLDLPLLMRRADAAMYAAKNAGRDIARFYEPEIEQLAQQRQSLEQQLRHALERGEFSLHYQPKVNAESLDVVGVEALLRWDNPALGSVSPARFIPVAEETGLIRPIGAWVLQQACGQLAQWHVKGFTTLTVSVNLSALQLTDAELVAQIQQCLQDHGIAPAALELEITESVLMDNTSLAVEQLAALKALGVHLSIDDFGTGYSSLAYLKRFAIDKLKIDQSFVRDMLTDPTDLAIIRAIIALGHTLGLKVVAEGVELAEVAGQLKALACDELQGYYFARPMPAEAFAPWLQDRKLRPERRRLHPV
ncbi:MAG: EAL domain-containing protein [Rhodoferax sp.]|uniref:EAL domain-containing protein n=1 Tax=Rhodoferax sp. TaxID=50421 RepID=UPI003264A96D